MNKIKKWAIIVALIPVVIIAVMFVGMVVYEITAPAFTEQKLQEYILKEVEPQLEEIREKYDLPDLELELEISDFKYTPPKLYSDGKFMLCGVVEAKIHSIYVSDKFSELDDDDKVKSVFGWYDDIPEISYIKVGSDTPRYSFRIRSDYEKGGLKQDYKTKSGNVYRFINTSFANSIYRNGQQIYCNVKKQSNSSKGKCEHCNGSGAVKYNYGDSDLQAIIDGHDASWYGLCTSCGGTGKVEKESDI